MAKILLIVLLVAGVASRKQNPKFPKFVGEESLAPKKVCSSQHDTLRDQVIQNSRCGRPREVFTKLKPRASYIQIIPNFVWVKQCVGLCNFDDPDTSCQPTSTRTEHIPVKEYDQRTQTETCTTYSVEVHESCRCCASSDKDCAAPRVFNPRKCSCHCPNAEERRNCLKKRTQNMRWNRYKCICEQKKKTQW